MSRADSAPRIDNSIGMPRADSLGLRRRPSARSSITRFAPIAVEIAPPTPVAPTLQGALLTDSAAAAALAHEYKPLLQAWWQAAYTAIACGALTHQEIASQDFAAMQRVMGLAMVEGMQRRWLSGCGPCSALALPNLALMPQDAVKALQNVHAFVVTRSPRDRADVIAHTVNVARMYILAGHLESDTVERLEHLSPRAAEALAATVFRAATAGALAARATQTVLLGVFWKMLEAYSSAQAGAANLADASTPAGL